MNDPNALKRLSIRPFQPTILCGRVPIAGFVWLLLSLSLPAQSTIQFQARAFTLAETAGQAALTVVRLNDLETDVAVEFYSVQATATAGQDFTAVSGTLSFAAGVTNQTIHVPILNDALVESLERFQVVLTNATGGAVVGSMKVAIVSIQDNDTGPYFASATHQVVEDAGTVQIQVNWVIMDSDEPQTVDYTTVDGTARAGTDYEAASGTLHFEKNEPLKQFPIVILNDGVKDPDKSFQLQLSNASSVGLGHPALTTVIVQDSTPVISAQPTPASQSVSLGAAVKIQVSAKGARMQWQKRVGEGEFTDVPGATGQVLEWSSATVDLSGEYRFVVSSTTGESVTSQIATVTVDPTFIKITEGPLAGTAGVSVLMPAWGDFNNDGYVDLIISDEGSYEPPQAAVPLIFVNQQDGTFRRAGVADVGPLAQSAMIGGMAGWGDYDNDGYLDFYQSREENGLHSVWRGVANDQFALVTDNIGINEIGDTWGYSWVDYDQDGFLDLNLSWAAASLFHNLGNGAFERLPATTFPRITDHQFNYWADYDLDGDPDVILCVGESGSRLYRNEGNGQFTDVTTPVISAAGWHACWADFDNDGDFDLCAAGAWSYPSGGIFRNDGNGQFSRLTDADMPDGVFGFWVDYDNDGYLDLCSGNSIREGQKQGLRMWRNLRDGTLSEIQLGSVTADGGGACGWGDYDNNGFLDLVVARRSGRATDLYRNNGNTNHWLMIKPVGIASNRSAIGVKVWAEATIWGEPVRLLRQLSGGMSQNDGRVHLGLGDATKVDTLRIEWPSGIVQELKDVAVDKILTVVESQDLILPEPLSIQTFELDATGVFHATVNCPVGGAVCVLESSSDLEQWSKVKVGTISGGTVEFTDARAGDSPGKFYRVLVP